MRHCESRQDETADPAFCPIECFSYYSKDMAVNKSRVVLVPLVSSLPIVYIIKQHRKS